MDYLIYVKWRRDWWRMELPFLGKACDLFVYLNGHFGSYQFEEEEQQVLSSQIFIKICIQVYCGGKGFVIIGNISNYKYTELIPHWIDVSSRKYWQKMTFWRWIRWRFGHRYSWGRCTRQRVKYVVPIRVWAHITNLTASTDSSLPNKCRWVRDGLVGGARNEEWGSSLSNLMPDSPVQDMASPRLESVLQEEGRRKIRIR